jgi:hypothetical protein
MNDFAQAVSAALSLFSDADGTPVHADSMVIAQTLLAALKERYGLRSSAIAPHLR